MIAKEDLPVPFRSVLPFRPAAPASEIARVRAGRSVIRKLEAERNEMAAEGVPASVIARVDAMLDNMRAWCELSDPQLEELVLSSIEKYHLYLVTEIADHLALKRAPVEAILKSLEADGRVYFVSRLVPGSDRPQWMVKSSRVANVEVTSSILPDVARAYHNPDPVSRI